jgi:hypothetical protein
VRNDVAKLAGCRAQQLASISQKLWLVGQVHKQPKNLSEKGRQVSASVA